MSEDLNVQATPVQPQAVKAAPSLAEPLSVGQYLIIFLLSLIPVANIILYFIWAFNSSINPNKRNFARAVLLWAVILTAVWLICFVIFGTLIAAMMSQGATN